jgi:pectate lyase
MLKPYLVVVFGLIASSLVVWPYESDSPAQERRPAAAPRAFPTAEGFGALATGGRGGEVVHVTNLDDSGPGSLRDAVSKGSRIVIFDVGGYVELKSILHVPSDVTILGQSAPGDGIGVKNYEVSFSKSHNVIVRYLRIRMGLTPKQEKKYAIGLSEGSNMIFDHVSIQFGRWDCIGMSGSKDVTFQHCIIGPGVGPQRFGCLCESDNVTFSHNLWISNQSRSPKAKGVVQYVNNVVYNWGVCGYVGGHSGADHRAVLENNYFIKGPSSSEHFAGEFKPTDHLFQSGNLLDSNRDGELNGRPVTPEDFGTGANAPTLEDSTTIRPPVPVKLDSAEVAYKKVVAGAGCSLHRDAVDTRLIADLKSLGKQGSTINDPAEMGGFGELKGGPLPPGAEKDGIPTAWKKANGLDPADPRAAEKISGNDGYSNLERYLNEVAGDVPAGR